jgi:multidrug efflux pump subunit AcrA (membrane-fusion protein)
MSDSKTLRTQNQPTLKLIYYRHWLALFIIGTILALLLLWAIFGKISIQATGKGIILPDQKGIYAISNPGSGVVQQVKVITGQHIDKDQVIAVVDQSKLATQLS